MRRILGAAPGICAGVAVLMLAGPASAAVRPLSATVYPPGETCSVSLQVQGAHGSGSVPVSPGQPFVLQGAGWTPLSPVTVTDTTIRPKSKQSSKTTSTTAGPQGSFTVTITYDSSQVGTTHQFTANGTCTPTGSPAPQQASATASTLVVVSGGQKTRSGGNGNGTVGTAVLGESFTRTADSAALSGRSVLGPLPFTGSEYALLGVVLAIILIFTGSALNRWARRHRRRA